MTFGTIERKKKKVSYRIDKGNDDDDLRFLLRYDTLGFVYVRLWKTSKKDPTPPHSLFARNSDAAAERIVKLRCRQF